MSNTLSSEQIRYIQDWFESGNLPRFAAKVEDNVVGHETSGVEDMLPDSVTEMLDEHEDTFCWLNPAGIAIGRLAKAFGKACEGIEEFNEELQRWFEREGWGYEEPTVVTRMRENRKELLGV